MGAAGNTAGFVALHTADVGVEAEAFTLVALSIAPHDAIRATSAADLGTRREFFDAVFTLYSEKVVGWVAARSSGDGLVLACAIKPAITGARAVVVAVWSGAGCAVGCAPIVVFES